MYPVVDDRFVAKHVVAGSHFRGCLSDGQDVIAGVYGARGVWTR